MRNRAVVRLLLTGLALGVVVTLVRLAGPSSAIVEARAKCAALRVGMSEAAVEAALGAPAAQRGKLWGYWMEDSHRYATRSPDLGPSTGPGAKLYDWRQWDFGHRSTWSFERFMVGALLDHGHVVYFWSMEDRENAAERWLKQAGRRLSLDTTVLSHRHSGPSQASKASP